MPETVKELIARKVKCKGRYSPELRSFALTLHFYSPKAYNYVRKTWSLLLPHPSTIKQWYRVVDGSPGFTKEALDAIKLRSLATKKPVIINLVIDEMSIREQVVYNEGKLHGGVDFGTLDNDSDSIETAKNALVFMAVSLNDNWKVPIAYFLISSLSGQERSNLLTQALEMLYDSNAHVFSITFDGAPTNISMCTHLGANFQYGHDFKPYFTNPVTLKKCFIFFDICHMIKLIRNTLGDKRMLKTSNNEIISWHFLEKLHQLQQREGLKAANKLSNKHINFSNNRMNVKLAMQTLSESVYKSFMFLTSLDDDNIKKDFDGCLPTADFCLQFNNMTDMLNCKNKFSRHKFNTALTESNYSELKAHAAKFENYIITLCDAEGTFILKSQRKIGFLGMIIGLRNMFLLFDELKGLGLTYLLTFKLSQDYIETFFSALRSRGGFNNNPNVLQFKSAYKRLLVRHEIKEVENGNCLFDNVEILHVSSKNLKCPIVDTISLNDINVDFAHDYVKTFWNLSLYVENVVLYIAGYICM